MSSTNLIRELIDTTFSDLGAPLSDNSRETPVIRGGYYCARHFECGEFHAIWFIEENQVKFYGRNGVVLHVCSPGGRTYAKQVCAAR